MAAPSGDESRRARFLLERFLEAGLSEVATDEMGNAIGRLRGRLHNRLILITAHMDSVFSASENHQVTVDNQRIIGPGVGDNAVGVAVLGLLPEILECLGIELDADLLLVGTTRSVGRGNHGGIRFFLDHCRERINFGMCLEGMQLGRLNSFSIGTARADIICTAKPSNGITGGHPTASALVVLNHIVHQILSIPLPSQPFTRIKLGKMHAGRYYDVEPERAELGLEIISHSDEMIEQVCTKIADIVAEMGARYNVEAAFDRFFLTKSGGIPFSHPLVKAALEVLQQLGIEPDQTHALSELSALVSRRIPGITVGTTRGVKNHPREPDYVLIEPILVGVAQVVGILRAMDEGRCDEPAAVAR
jgi:acetylornithine deacetylase/succinyl-diaminopimelate desuccinylase-like protein